MLIMKKNKTIQKIVSDSLINIDVVIPGRLRSVLMKCGKASCPCGDDPDKRHGPYFFWDRKVNGKLSSVSIPKELVPTFEQWIKNRKKLDATVKKIIDSGQRFAAKAKNTRN
jgi:hypothetical protein